MIEQRATRGQPGAGLGGRGGYPGKLEDQADRGATAGDVVVEVPVQPFEPAVEVGRERGHQELDVQVGKVRGAGQLPQPDGFACLLG